MSLTFQRMGIILETAFARPVPFSDTLIQELAFKALAKFRPYGLSPMAISSSPADRLFGYAFSFSLGKAVFRVTADKMEINSMDATSEAEAKAFWAFVPEAAGIVTLRDEDVSTFQMYAHCAFKSEADRNEFLKIVSLPKGVNLGGFIVYSTPETWKREIRLQVDRSVFVKDGLFILSGTTIPGLINKDILFTVYKHFEDLAVRNGIKIITDTKDGQQPTTKPNA